jgi:hypothetical protein
MRTRGGVVGLNHSTQQRAESTYMHNIRCNRILCTKTDDEEEDAKVSSSVLNFHNKSGTTFSELVGSAEPMWLHRAA